jgi:hypothetical protein
MYYLFLIGLGVHLFLIYYILFQLYTTQMAALAPPALSGKEDTLSGE